MSDVETALKEVKKVLYSDPLIQEYFRLKKEIENNEELTSLDKSVRLHQKKMCENIANDEVYLLEKELYEQDSKKLNSNPLVQNFDKVKEEVLNLLSEIKATLE